MSNINDAREVIVQSGDLLERFAFSNDSFAHQFSIYPQVWLRYVATNRAPGKLTLANTQWLRFAERHYSAFVRCWTTNTAKDRIRDLCHKGMDQIDPSKFLDVHESLLSYFCNKRGAIDNLRYAFHAFPVESPEAFEKFAARQTTATNLHWFYVRGTQFIHKAVVPCFGKNGLMAFDASFFEEVETQWDRPRSVKVEAVSDLIDTLWQYFVDEMHGAWCKLFDILNSRSVAIKPIEIQPLKPIDLEWSSGSLAHPHGWPCLPTASGEPDEFIWPEGGIN